MKRYGKPFLLVLMTLLIANHLLTVSSHAGEIKKVQLVVPGCV